MTAFDLLQRLIQHKMWTSQKLLRFAGELTEEQLHARFPIGQGSIWKTLTHLCGADYVWLEALLGDETPLMQGDAPHQLPGNQLGENPFTSLTELAKFWHELDVRWMHYLSLLQDVDLSAPVVKVSTSSKFGHRIGTRKSDVLLHLCTHAQYTTAQAVNMFKQAGVEPLPDVMLITLARQEPGG